MMPSMRASVRRGVVADDQASFWLVHGLVASGLCTESVTVRVRGTDSDCDKAERRYHLPMRLSVNMLKSQGQGLTRPPAAISLMCRRTPPVRSRTEGCSHKLSDVAGCWNPSGMVPVR